MPAPKRPRQLSDYAARTLEALAAEGLGHQISLGRALGLLKVAGKTVFSFQIASRSAQLAAPEQLPWADVSLDSLTDLIASKMAALVERGAPRDFRDIYTLCDSGLTSARDCWSLWEERQRKAGSDADRHRARLAVQTHLARIARHRPLEAISEAAQRDEAARVRTWFAEVLLDATLPD